jgi:AcrR family transcriptional regulator
MVQILSEDKDSRRRHILQAASQVFREKGFHGAGMRDIAAAIGIAVGKLYYWFENKQSLLAFCQTDCLQSLLAMADHVCRRVPDPSGRLHHLVVGHLRCLNEWRVGSLAHLEIECLEDPHRTQVLALRDRYERRIRRIVQDGVRKGVFRGDVDPAVASLVVLGAANWSVKWYRPTGRLSLPKIAEAFAAHLVRGLLVDPARFSTPCNDPFAEVDHAS